MHGTKPIRQVQFKAAWANAARANREARSFELPLRIRGAVSQPASAASACWRVAAVINGAEGPVSIEATASTLSTPAPCDTPGTCPIGR